MRCTAVIEADTPDLDTVIVWDDNTRLVAVAYQDGQIKMTRPLDAATLNDGIAEIQTQFHIDTGHVTRITDWANLAVQSANPGVPARWGA